MEKILSGFATTLFPALSFESPWMLATLALLPLLWLLLRLTPPAPKTAMFPAIRFLFGLRDNEQTSARTPWWILLLRLLLAVAIILAAAHPVLNAVKVVPNQPLLLVIDDDWASARFWQNRKQELTQALDQAERAASPVRLLSTATPADGTALALSQEMTAADARVLAQALVPKPWTAERAAMLRLLEAMPRPDKPMRVVWLSNGLEDAQTPALMETFQRLGGGVTVLADHPATLPHVLLPPRTDAGGMSAEVSRVVDQGADSLAVRALNERGQVLGRFETTFEPGTKNATLRLSLPGELRNQVARLDIENETTAAAVVLLDERWRRHPVGIVSLKGEMAVPLLDDSYYVERALTPIAEIRRGTITALLKQELAVLFLGDHGSLTKEETTALQNWIGKGGILVRFSGPLLAGAEQGDGATALDSLLPVRLRSGSRVLGGAMSWSVPAGLAPFPENSPFFRLPVDHIQVSKQVLAEPSLDLNEKTWAHLSDGTPLVTAARRGEGWSVLFHTTAGPEWSDLALSGLFVDMLRRLNALSLGMPGRDDGLALAPQEILDGFGRLSSPSTSAHALTAAELEKAVPGPLTPPGIYGSVTARHALNLSPSLPRLAALKERPGVDMRSYGGLPVEQDLLPWLLSFALFLALIDTIASLALRGVFSGRRMGGKTMVWAALGLLAVAGGNTSDARAAATEDDAFLLQVTAHTPLAYVLTHDPQIDQISRDGLIGLNRILDYRTTAAMGEPIGIDIEQDSLYFYPSLYWPVTASQQPPSPAARDKINDYLRRGGMILFDTGTDNGFSAPLPRNDPTLARLSAGLKIPSLAPVTESHVLSRTFYLMRDFPGRFGGEPVWAATETSSNDGVSPVIIGAGGWAAAWATDARGQPRFAVIPGGERQREMAYRFGVNWIMYALTGNYKADQVHTPAILERLGR